MAYRVAIVDDSNTDIEYVRNILNLWARERQSAVHAECFGSAEDFLFDYTEDKSWDILLLDIEMGAMDGVTLAKRVRRDNAEVQIVFITGYSDYIAEGYEVAALHYLMKPVNRDKLFSVFDRAIEKRRQDERCLNLETNSELVRIPFYEIRYLDVRQNYVTVHAKSDYTVKRALGDFESELDSRFFRAGRSMILNLKYIQRVTKTEVHLSGGIVLPLPRGAYESLNRAIITHT
ncbi:MAG: response regulator transcription factor [Clostridia bacterium]|nr:response regulator transcription factor [Clostridia bacterium]